MQLFSMFREMQTALSYRKPLPAADHKWHLQQSGYEQGTKIQPVFRRGSEMVYILQCVCSPMEFPHDTANLHTHQLQATITLTSERTRKRMFSVSNWFKEFGSKYSDWMQMTCIETFWVVSQGAALCSHCVAFIYSWELFQTLLFSYYFQASI